MRSLVKLTRRVAFSSGHRYWFADRSPEQNREIFGPLASPYNHGHNYILDVECTGQIDSATGMVVNIKLIDNIVREKIVSAFDQKSINDEVQGFENIAPNIENLLMHFAEVLPFFLPTQVKLTALRLEEMPTLYGEWRPQNMITLTRVYEFAASHRLNAPTLSQSENIELFGKCNNPNGHGHNYELEVTVSGEPDPVTGFIANLADLDAIVHSEVVDRYDHKNLNEDLEEFQDGITTSEAVCYRIFERLKGKVPAKLERIRLKETARNIFEVTAD